MFIFDSMEVNVKIGLNELLAAIKKLPDSQLAILKGELNKPVKPIAIKNKALKQLLLEGPVFDKDQLTVIKETRKSINKWRTV